MAPEQAAGKVHDIGPPCDVYALGAILYEMLTGRPPFKGDDTGGDRLAGASTRNRCRRPACSPEYRDLETICLKCLARKPPKRYASAEALADDLRQLLGGSDHPGPAGPGLGAWLKWARRRPTTATLLCGLAAVLAFVGAALQYDHQPESTAEDETIGGPAD